MIYCNKNTLELKTLKVLEMQGFSSGVPIAFALSGWYEVQYDYPEYDEYTQKLVAQKTLDWDAEKEVFIQHFDIVSLSSEEANSVLEQKKAIALEKLRQERNLKLKETDYLLMLDYPISEDNLVEVKAYRQALRDLPKQEGSPWLNNVIPWPNKPSVLGE